MIAGLHDYMILVVDHSVMLFLPQRHRDAKLHKDFTGYGLLCVPSCLCGDSPFNLASLPNSRSSFDHAIKQL
jgi:hypothetical protein